MKKQQSSLLDTTILLFSADKHSMDSGPRIEMLTEKAKESIHFGKDKAGAEKWAKEYFEKWKGDLDKDQKKLLIDSPRLQKMNIDVEKFRGSIKLMSESTKDDMDRMDKALKERSAKLHANLYVYKKLKSTDLGYTKESF